MRARRPLARPEPDLHKLMLVVSQLHASVVALGQNEIPVGAGNGRWRPRMLKPGIDLVHGVQYERNVLERDAQAFLIRARHNRLRGLDRRKPALMHLRCDQPEQQLVLAWRKRRRFARFVDPGDGMLQLRQFGGVGVGLALQPLRRRRGLLLGTVPCWIVDEMGRLIGELDAFRKRGVEEVQEAAEPAQFVPSVLAWPRIF